MIELEIQGLAQNRDGLLIDVGRLVMAHGFTLQRQRLVQDPHGTLLTIVVRGPRGGKKSLQAALDDCERLVSVQIFPFVEGETRPHFAASLPRAAYVPPPVPVAAIAPVSTATMPPVEVEASDPIVDESTTDTSALQGISATGPDFDFIQPAPQPSAPPVADVVLPFVELVPLAPDELAVEKVLRSLDSNYPNITPELLALQQSVNEASRESSLALAGQRTGNWVFAREYSLDDELDLREAIERIGVPALRALVEVDLKGNQLHIHDSPLCGKDGQSGCGFFGGFLEGLLGPAIAPASLMIFPVCCRSFGADACVLDLSD
ncbi:hypothetical protein [Rhodanobacter sp. L36]|uniref:hypothetical protein n=1 Tax=Rhodanobacter sp. L36 TaxID=1747221 RepID=UPI00131CB8A2|nr:hypothetical protein [Rhodanobacter sp. L36]